MGHINPEVPCPQTDTLTTDALLPSAKYTPGPWSHGAPAWFRGRSNPEDGKRPITAGDSPVIGNVYGAANARLIAAAPDLVEALKWCVEVIQGEADQHNITQGHPYGLVLTSARDALTKAGAE